MSRTQYFFRAHAQGPHGPRTRVYDESVQMWFIFFYLLKKKQLIKVHLDPTVRMTTPKKVEEYPSLDSWFHRTARKIH